jgi:hypothetical protein
MLNMPAIINAKTAPAVFNLPPWREVRGEKARAHVTIMADHRLDAVLAHRNVIVEINGRKFRRVDARNRVHRRTP